MREQDPWGKFQAEHEDLHEEGTFGRIVIMLILILVGAGIGAFLGALLNPGPRHTRIQRMMDTLGKKLYSG